MCLREAARLHTPWRWLTYPCASSLLNIRRRLGVLALAVDAASVGVNAERSRLRAIVFLNCGFGVSAIRVSGGTRWCWSNVPLDDPLVLVDQVGPWMVRRAA